MKSSARMWFAAALLPVALASSDPTPTVVAVIDLGRTIEFQKSYDDKLTEIDTWQATTQESLDQESTKLESLRAELETFRPDTPEYEVRAMELQVEEFKAKQQLERLNQQLEDQKARAMLEAYERVKTACDTLMKQRGIDLILQSNPHPIEARPLSRRTVLDALVVRTVVARRDYLDITEDVLSILNAE